MKTTKQTIKKVNFQSTVNIHIYSISNGIEKYIDSQTVNYKQFFAMNYDEFYFANECKDTLEMRLNKVKKAGYNVYSIDALTYKYKAVKSNDKRKNQLAELKAKNAKTTEKIAAIKARTEAIKSKIEDLKQSQITPEILEQVELLGRKAYESGQGQIPAQNFELMALIKELHLKIGDSTDIINKWIESWHAACDAEFNF